MITDKPWPVLTAILQNTPALAGSLLNTLTQDYDHERYFRVPLEIVHRGGRDANADALRRLYDQLKNSLKELTTEQELSCTSGYYASEAGGSHAVAAAMHNWVLAEESKDYTPPLKFSFLKSTLSLEALRFCSRRGISQYLLRALTLTEQHFRSVRQISTETEQDPETGEKWLILDVMIEGDVDDVLDNYDNYTDAWVASVPWPERDMIRLSYNII